MDYRLRGLLLLLSICTVSLCIAQPSTSEYTTLIPPSAEASSLGKYLDAPTNNHTGAISIPINLYTATSNKLTLPISINYHGGGIKVEEMASWVGTGWTLSAGGMVSRTIRGIQDEDPNGYIAVGSTIDKNDLGCYANVVARIKDSESDVYSFQAPGIYKSDD